MGLTILVILTVLLDGVTASLLLILLFNLMWWALCDWWERGFERRNK